MKKLFSFITCFSIAAIGFSQSADVAQSLSVADVGNFHGAADLEFAFDTAPNQPTISEYRAIIVPAAATFNVDSALLVTSGNYIAYTAPLSDNVVDTLAAGATDNNGNAVVLGTAYNLYVLSIADGVNATTDSLSGASASSVTLVDPTIYSFPFIEDFEGGNVPPTDWVIYDADGDGNDFRISVPANGEPANGTFSAVSASWLGPNPGSPLTPDNYLVTPAIDLANVGGASNIELHWEVEAVNQSFPGDFYEFYVSTTGNATADFPVASSVFSEAVPTSTGMISRTVDITSFIGDTVWIALRHHNSNDLERIAFDDIGIRESFGNDLVLDDVTFGSGAYITPLSQLNGGLSFAGNATNEGINVANNAWLRVDVDGGLYRDTATVASIASGASQAFSYTNPFVPSGTGAFGAQFTLGSDSTDQFPGNNVLVDSAIVSDTVYANFRGAAGALGGALAGATDNEFGVKYEIFAMDTASSMTVEIVAPSLDAEYYAAIYNVNGGTVDDVPLYISDTILMDPNVNPTDPFNLTVPFDKSYAILIPGEYVVAITELNGADAIGMTTNGEAYRANTSYTRSSLVANAWTLNDAFWTGDFNWPIRLNLGRSGYVDPNAGISSNIKNSTRIYPNPATDVVMIEGLVNTNSIQISDISGRIVESINSINKNSVSINTSDFVKGIYLVTVKGTDRSEVHKLVIK